MYVLGPKICLHSHPEEKGKCKRLKDREICKTIRDTNDTYSRTTDTGKFPTDSKRIGSDGGRLMVSDPTVLGVIEALEDLGQASTAEIQNHSAVDRSKRQVRRALDYLDEDEAVEWVRNGRSTAYTLIES